MKVPTVLASLAFLAALNAPAVAVDRNIDTPFLCDLGTNAQFDLSDVDYLITRVQTAAGDIYYFDPAQNGVQMIDAKYQTIFIDRNFSPETLLTINNLPVAQSPYGEILEGTRNDNAPLRCLQSQNKRFVKIRRTVENPGKQPNMNVEAMAACGGYVKAVGALRVQKVGGFMLPATVYHQTFLCF